MTRSRRGRRAERGGFPTSPAFAQQPREAPYVSACTHILYVHMILNLSVVSCPCSRKLSMQQRDNLGSSRSAWRRRDPPIRMVAARCTAPGPTRRRLNHPGLACQQGRWAKTTSLIACSGRAHGLSRNSARDHAKQSERIARVRKARTTKRCFCPVIFGVDFTTHLGSDGGWCGAISCLHK